MLSLGCAGTYESSVRDDLAAREERYSEAPAPNEAPSGTRSSHEVAIDGSLAGYLAVALQENPELRASFERWEASVHRISKARRLPNPTLGFGIFIRSIETRVGPQQARLSLQQAFPWPTKLTAGADAASASARSNERSFDAQTLAVSLRVATAYWNLWQIRSTREIHRQHVDVIRGLSESVRARIATGTATLAELQQIDLTVARLEDNILGMDEDERAAAAQLRAAIGSQGNAPVPTTDGPPEALLPAKSSEALAAAARKHPRIESRGLLAESAESTARAEAAERLPSFSVGADWIITGEAVMPNTPDSGKDAVIVGGAVSLPLWQGSYADSVDASRAEARAHRSEQRALENQALSDLTSSLSNVRDAARRVKLYRGTLVPQAESAYESVLGAYTVGRGTVAQTLLAQRDLLELRVDLDRARADHARAWARLEEIVGAGLERATAPSAAEAGPRGDENKPTEDASPRDDAAREPSPNSR